MSRPSNREEFKDYCLRQLGAPVLEINVDEDQIDDRIDDAIQYYQEYHFDGVERMYLKHQFTAEDVERFKQSNELSNTDDPDGSEWKNRKNFIEVPDHVIGIQKVFGVTSNLSSNEMWGLSNQYFLLDVFSFSSGYTFGNFDMSYYYMIKQYFETLDMVVNTGGLVEYRFNKRQDRLFLDIDTDRVIEGRYLIIDCYRALDPQEWSQVYNDSFLKRYAPALIKRQWGQNMIKYNNIQLPGGVTMNGRQLWEDGNNEVKDLESRMISDYSLPPMDMIG
jgi:hypothetical protein